MDRSTILIPPVVVFLCLCGLVVLAGVKDHWPVQPRPCEFRTFTGIPCVGCGGTRAFASLARGDVVTATTYNPLAVAGFGTVACWLGHAVMRARRPIRPRVPPTPRQRARRHRWIIAIIVIAILGNWLYLIRYLES